MIFSKNILYYFQKNKRGIITDIITENDVTQDIVLVIDETGKQLGKMSINDAYVLSKSKKLDLALVVNTVDKKIAKIVDYGKILYNQKKQKKNQKNNTIKVKEIKFGLNVAENDYNIKINHIKQFLSENCRVKVYLTLKGREVEMVDYAHNFMEKVVEDLKGYGKTEDKIEIIGKNILLSFNK